MDEIRDALWEYTIEFTLMERERSTGGELKQLIEEYAERLHGIVWPNLSKEE